LAYELTKSGLKVRTQVGLPFNHEEVRLEIGYRIDIIVNDLVIIEVKSVDALTDVYYKQVLTYLKLSDKKLGLLVNFNTLDISKAIRRIANNL
jgi:GxxExxY protein